MLAVRSVALPFTARDPRNEVLTALSLEEAPCARAKKRSVFTRAMLHYAFDSRTAE